MARSVALLCCGDESAARVVNAGSVASRPDGRAAAHVREVLKSREFRLVSCTSWRRFRRCAATAHAAVIVSLRLDLDDTRPGLRSTADDPFPCPLILVTSSHRENLRYLGAVRVIDVVFLDEVKRRLAPVLTSMAFSDGRLRLRAAIHRREMHLTLKRALLRVVDLPFLGPGAFCGPRQRFPRTVEDLAELADVTAHYLRHLAADVRLPLGRILRQHAALRALEMLAAGVGATALVRCFGYSDASGVRKLIGRNLGGRIDRLSEAGLEPHYTRTARLVESNGRSGYSPAPVVGPPSRGPGQSESSGSRR